MHEGDQVLAAVTCLTCMQNPPESDLDAMLGLAVS